MPQCAISGCFNTHRKTRGGPIRYHRFPGDVRVRARWLKACGRRVNNCATARVCSRHFHSNSYERDIQHELLGLPTRCRLRKGAIPTLNLPHSIVKCEETNEDQDQNGIAVLLAVGLIPTLRGCGGQPADLNKMHVMEDVREGSDVPGAQPSSPGHAEQRSPAPEIPPKSPVKNGEKSDGETKEEIKEETEKVMENIKEEKPTESEIESMIEKDITMENDSIDDSNDSVEGNSKRKSETDESPMKRMRSQLQQNFTIRDNILSECVNSSGSSNELHGAIEQILNEIRTLNDLALEKEREWNNIIHLRCIKEELLLRLQRRKQILLATDKNVWNDIETLDLDADEDKTKPYDSNNTKGCMKYKATPTTTTNKLNGKRSLNPRTLPYPTNVEMNGQSNDLKQNRQRPVIDVQSIIADYRQRHPETVPRRGRRIRSLFLSQGENKMKLNSKNQGNHHTIDSNNELSYLLSAMDAGKKSGANSGIESLSGMDASSFKDVLFHIARLSQSERQELQQTNSKPPPPYSEVTVHPVPVTTQAVSNSLLHGILTKSNSKMENKSTFSPTLARLLTAPERAASSSPNTVAHSTPQVSISDILSHSKSRNEITITPVGSQFATKEKDEEEEGEDGVDRLVIDEGGEEGGNHIRNETGSDGGDEVPQCQGCNQKPAQFVCAGCGNQWYCSRDCQVSAWDEHSEVCSG